VQQLLGRIICHRVLAPAFPPTVQLAACPCPYLFYQTRKNLSNVKLRSDLTAIENTSVLYQKAWTLDKSI
jgi:hypothetical protein